MKAYLKVKCRHCGKYHSCWTDGYFYYYDCPRIYESNPQMVYACDDVEDEE